MTIQAFLAERMDGMTYHQFMDAGFRRDGRVFYQPICAGCRQCLPIRVPVAGYQPNKSQRRCRRRNSDLVVETASPKLTDEKSDLFRRYQHSRHPPRGEPVESTPPGDASDALDSEADDRPPVHLYTSAVRTVEFTYRDPAGRLLAVGICDVCPRSVSSVYFFFDPDESARGLGIFGAVCEIEFAERRNIPYYYLGYWVRDCRSMRYKSQFRPCEVLDPDGCWRTLVD